MCVCLVWGVHERSNGLVRNIEREKGGERRRGWIAFEDDRRAGDERWEGGVGF